MSSQQQPIPLAERVEVIDVLRGLAIGGILIGNMQWFSGYGMAPTSIAAVSPEFDRPTVFRPPKRGQKSPTAFDW
mgnify:CR=1 FL=1